MKKLFSLICAATFFSCNASAADVLNVENNSTNVLAGTSFSPAEYIYKEKLGTEIELYTRYAQYFTNFRANGDASKVQLVLESEDSYLRYYESILKGLYLYYYGNRFEQQTAMEMFMRVYDRAFDKLRNSFEGFMVQSVFLKENYKSKLNIITTSTYCNNFVKPTDQIACVSDYVASLGITKNPKYTLELLKLSQQDSRIAARVQNFVSLK